MGLGQILNVLEKLREAGVNEGLELGGILMTMFDRHTNLAHQVGSEVRNHFDELVFRLCDPIFALAKLRALGSRFLNMIHTVLELMHIVTLLKRLWTDISLESRGTVFRMNYIQSAELEAFITHITLERRLSVNTVRNYRQAVVRFSGWLQQNLPESSSFKAAQPIHVRSYIVDLGRILPGARSHPCLWVESLLWILASERNH